MKHALLFVLLLVASSQNPFAAPPGGAEKALLGFSEAGSGQQRRLEANFDSSLSRSDLQQWLKHLSARPHHVGSPYGKMNAQFIDSMYRSWGFRTAIEEFDVL